MERQVTVQGGRLAARKHTIYALIEVDVTEPRRMIQAYKARTGEALSFTAFVIACLGKAIDQNKRMHAYRDWRNRLIVFDLKKSFGTVGMTSVGMLGKGSGWAIPFGVHTLDVALGGIAEKPGVIDGRIEIRENLCLTLSFDHDVIDGAPAARFTGRFKELIESG